MVSAHKKKYHSRRLLGQLKESLIDFLFGEDNQEGLADGETVGPQNDGLVDISGGATLGRISTSHNNQVLKKLTKDLEKRLLALLLLSETAFLTAFFDSNGFCGNSKG